MTPLPPLELTQCPHSNKNGWFCHSCVQILLGHASQDWLRQAGTLIEKERFKKKWTQAELAKLAGIHKTNISRLEAGSFGRTCITIRKVAKALGLPFSRFLLLNNSQPHFERPSDNNC